MCCSKLNVIEIFSSLQGEGIYAGEPSCFVRLHGCNLNCYFCDTKKEMGKIPLEMDVEQIVTEIETHHFKSIVITGGEPLLQQEGLVSLLNLLEIRLGNKRVTIETNGSIKILPELVKRQYILWSISPKIFVSETMTSNFFENLKAVRTEANLQLKLLWSRETTLQDFLTETLSKLDRYSGTCNYHIFIQPIILPGEDIVDVYRELHNPESLEFLKHLKRNVKSIRFTGQLHKLFKLK